ncbi:DUF2147 domain-containing protein [Paracoccus suum]|uniref:DUF2147 domain-containing protein n=2 Tax=Paracoccus suum TaxID=2259340 RepID=A0A344PNR2_9RHOB|nr:DUF2147 domain-containing protein [Paracoccus suum]
MRTFLAAAALAVLGSTAAQAEGINGIFQTQANDQGDVGMVQFAKCGDKYCGKLIKSFHKDGKEFASASHGRNIVANMVDNGGGSFSGGTIWDPGADKTYKSKMTLSGKTLNVSGCIAVFCKTQTWTKVQ